MEIKKRKVITDVAILTPKEIAKFNDWIENLESPCEQVRCEGIACEGNKCPVKELDDLYENFVDAFRKKLIAIEERQASTVYEKD